VEEWAESICDEEALNELVFDGVLPDRETAGWQPAYGESFLTPNGDELVVFADCFHRGLSCWSIIRSICAILVPIPFSMYQS
jgi:hypothetical protein